MTQQFSKLNKLGAPFKQKKQAKFSIGKKAESSSDSDDDYENSIFQPDMKRDKGSLQYATDSSCSFDKNDVEEAVEAVEDPSSVDVKPADVFMPGVGIVMRTASDSNSNEPSNATMEQRHSISAESSQVNK